MSIREGRVALSVGHPRGTHSRYVSGCCLIPLGICGLKNNSRRITHGIGCVWGMPSLSPLSSLDYDPSIYGIQQVEEINYDTLSLFSSGTGKACLRDLLNSRSFIGETENTVFRNSCLIEPFF